MEQDTDPLASNNQIISGGGDAHLLDQILGLFRRQTIGSKKRFQLIQLPVVAAALVLTVASIVGFGFLAIETVRDPARVFSGDLTKDRIPEVPTTTDNESAATLTIAEEFTADNNPANLSGRIGVVGCSNTQQHAVGYAGVSSEDKLWNDGLDIGGGALSVWADINGNGSDWWANFQSNLDSKGADAVWFQICLKSGSTSPDGMTTAAQENVKTVINEIKARTNNATVYISPLNSFTENDCTTTGQYGVSNSVELADWAAEQGLAVRGPDTGPLTHDQLEPDLCHLNNNGKDFVGQQLVSFFDNGDVVLPPPDPVPEPLPSPEPTPLPEPSPKPDPVVSPTDNNLSADFTYSPTSPKAGEPVYFTSLSQDDGKIIRVAWFFSDGATAHDVNQVVHVFKSAGTYKIGLKVVDDSGNRAVVIKQITVK